MNRQYKLHNFRNLLVWKRGIELSISILKTTKTFPSQNRFDITSQIIRCSVSIPSNIAEGSSRKSMKDFCRFLDISLGSAFELETQLFIAKECQIGNSDKIEILINETVEMQKMIVGFKRNIYSQMNN